MSICNLCTRLKPVSFCIEDDSENSDHVVFEGIGSPEITVQGVGHLDAFFKNVNTGAIYQAEVLYIKDSNPARVYITYEGTEFPLAVNTDYELWFTRQGETTRMLMEIDGVQEYCFLFSGIIVIDGLTNETISYPAQTLFVDTYNSLCEPCTKLIPVNFCNNVGEDEENSFQGIMPIDGLGGGGVVYAYFKNLATGQIYKMDAEWSCGEVICDIIIPFNEVNFPLAIGAYYKMWFNNIDGLDRDKLLVEIDGTRARCFLFEGQKIVNALTGECVVSESIQYLKVLSL